MIALADLALLIVKVINVYIYVLIAAAILSWLVAFGIVNRYNNVVNRVGHFLQAVTEPVLRPIRRVIPLIGGVDLSPLILILVLWYAQSLLYDYVIARPIY
jgi:YggT family protein